MKSILVKTFLILNLILCAVVLGFSIKMFTDREIVKARTVIHRQYIEEIAGNLEWAESQPWEQEQDRMIGMFQLSDPQNMEQLPTFIGQLEALSTLAEQRVTQLSAQFAELTETQNTLEETRSTLATRVAELADTRSRVAGLETSLANSKTSLGETNNQVATLERENASLQQQIDGLDQQMADQRTEISRLEEVLNLRTTERNTLQTLLDACRRPRSTGPGGEGPWDTKTARILAVEPEWNYVVINKGEVDVLPMYLEAFVHRGDDFIGKIRVMQVDRTVALAEILPETLAEGETIKAGDTIFF